MHNVYAIRVLVDGLTMGYTYRDSSHDLDLRWMGQLIENLCALGHRDAIVVEFRNEMDGRMKGMGWFIAERIDGTVWLNFFPEIEDDVQEVEDATAAYLNERGW